MATMAANFAQNMRTTWECGRGEENACVVAARRGAFPTHRAAWRHYSITPGDIPACLWQFTDGSRYYIADNGSIIEGLPPGRGGKDDVVVSPV